MNFGELLWWYLGNARDYAAQMLPCMCAGVAVYALALPVRRRRTGWGWSVPAGGSWPCCCLSCLRRGWPP